MNTPKEAYDLNFMFPVKELRTDKVLICPLIPSLHAQLYFDGTHEGDEETTFQHLRCGPFTNVSPVYTLFEEYRRDSGSVMFAIYDLTRGPEPEFAGVLGFMRADRRTLSLELGHVIISSKFRRTHVLSHACGLAIAYCLSAPPQGLGLRRVQWTAFPRNASSQKAAIRMGFKHEGIIRSFYDLRSEKMENHNQGYNSVEKRTEREGIWKMQSSWSEGIEREDRGIAVDCWLASITAGDWEFGEAKSVIEAQMMRKT